MSIQVSDEIKSKTKECPSNFHCLKDIEKPMCDESRPMCTADRMIEGNGLFVKPLSVNVCPYQIAYGYEFVCHCPTRHEIYKKFNV